MDRRSRPKPPLRTSKLITPDGVSPDTYTIDPATGCWLWLHAVNPNGYPRAMVKQRFVQPARILYEQRHGPVPPGHVLASTCPQRRCICPDHRVAMPRRELRAATGRGLTAAQVRQLRADAPHHTLAELSATYGVTQDTIRVVLRGTSWQDGTSVPVRARTAPKPTAVRQRWTGRLPAHRPLALPEREWQALVAFVDGQTAQQVADYLGLTRQGAAALITRASKRLAALVDGQTPDERS